MSEDEFKKFTRDLTENGVFFFVIPFDDKIGTYWIVSTMGNWMVKLPKGEIDLSYLEEKKPTGLD